MKKQVQELLYQALETEMGGVLVYEMAVSCAVHEELKKEWAEYHKQTMEHVRIVRETFAKVGLDPEAPSPGRDLVRAKAASLIAAMRAAKASATAEAAELVAAESVVEAETKDHLNWELIGQLAKVLKDGAGAALKEAYEKVEDQEDEHLYHTTGWVRELWLKSLGIPAVIPPPEEQKSVTTAIGAARAKQQRKSFRMEKPKQKKTA